MADHFAKLEPYEHELLSCCAEEAAEIVQIIMKAMRHGIDSKHPNPGSQPNRDEIATEIGQLVAITQMLTRLNILDEHIIEHARFQKWQKVGKYMHHVDINGPLFGIKIRPSQ